MSNKKYMIRESHYGCSDEDYFKTGTSLEGVYSDRKTAKEQVDKLTKAHKREFADFLPDLASKRPYSIVEVEENPMLYVLWNPAANEPFINEEVAMFGDFLIYGESRERADRLAFNQEIMEKKLVGTLDQLSDSPQLLEALIEAEEGLKYRTKTNELALSVKNAVFAMPALNALLKNPLYEIREMTPAQVQATEAKLEQVKEL